MSGAVSVRVGHGEVPRAPGQRRVGDRDSRAACPDLYDVIEARARQLAVEAAAESGPVRVVPDGLARGEDHGVGDLESRGVSLLAWLQGL